MFEDMIYAATKSIEVIGVLIIVGGVILSTTSYIKNHRQHSEDKYEAFRKQLGRSILLGLEMLVAADIIATVAVEPTLENVGLLGLIVIIRTFLSFSLEIELEGKLPWRTKKD